MRIAVFIKNTTVHASYGGLETQNAVLCKGLVAKGHDVTIFSPQRELLQDSTEQDGVKYVFVKSTYRMGVFLGFGGSLDKNNWFNSSVRSFITHHTKSPFDVVIGQSSAAIGIIKRKDELNVPVISISHGTILSEYKTYLSEIRDLKSLLKLIPNTGFVLKNFFFRQREMIHGSNKVVAVSNFVRNSIIEETFTNEDRVVVIHNGLDPATITPKKRSASQKVKLLYVGRLERSKGIHLLFYMLSTTQTPEMELVLVGQGPYKEFLQTMAHDLKLDDVVTFKGQLTHNDAINIYSDSDIFVLPTLRVEGFPMTLVEAMFVGLPVVASNMGGISDAVDDGSTGYLVRSNNLTELKEKLLHLAGDADLRTEFGKNATVKAQKEYTVNVMIEKYMQVLNEVVK